MNLQLDDLHVVIDRKLDLDRLSSLSSVDFSAAGYFPELAPISVEIQPTANCHRVCTFCSHVARNKGGRELSEAEVAGLLEEFRQMRIGRVIFSGGGEPLHWGLDRIERSIALADRFSRVALVSSGDQLWDREAGALDPSAGRLLPHLSEMFLNIPDVDEDEWRKQVVGGNTWPEARAMLTGLVELKARRSFERLNIYAVVVVTKQNIKNIGKIDETLAAIGVDGIYYKQFKAFEQRKVDKIKADNETLRLKIDELTTPDPRSPWLQRFVKSLSVPPVATARCWANRGGLFACIDPNGSVFACTPTVGDQTYAIGNIHDRRFQDVWSGRTRRTVVEELDRRAACGGCPAECREHPLNEAVELRIQNA